jgi:molecular chaperone DnaK
VTFSIDANGILSVTATDLGTNRSQSVSVTPTSGLTQAEVDGLVGEGEQFKEADQIRRELAELRNTAEALLYTTEQALEAYGDLLAPEKVESVKVEIDGLRAMLQSGADLESIREAYSHLENSTFEIAEAMYGGESDEGAAT